MMQLHKLHKHASELEWSGGGRGRVEVERLRGSERWVEKGKGGHTMTMKKHTVIKVAMIGPSVMSKKCHIDQSLQNVVNVRASNAVKGKGKAMSKPKTSKS